MKKYIILFLLFSALFSLEAIAAKRYWLGTTNSWKTRSNWSATSGGTPINLVPGSNDTAYFDSGGNAACSLDSNVNVKRMEVASSYTATITHSTNTITIGTGGALYSGGTFAGGSAAITLSGACTISGTAFTSTSGTFSTNSNFTYSSGSFTHNSGKMKFTATSTINAAGITMYDLEFAATATATFTITGGTTVTANHTATISGSQTTSLNSGTLDCKGDIVITNSATGGGGSATVNISGTGNQTLDGSSAGNVGRLPNVVINKASGTLYMQDHIVIVGNYTRTAGDTDPQTSNVHFTTTKTISGVNDTLYDVGYGAGIYTVSMTIMRILHELSIGGTSDCTINTGTLYAEGDITITNSATNGGGSATIVINGGGNQTLTGNGVAAQGKLPHVTINKSTGTLTLASFISSAGDWVYTQGTVSSSGSTVAFYGNFNLDGQAGSSGACMPFYNVRCNANTRTLTGNVDCNNDFIIGSSGTCSAGSYKIYVGGNWNSAGTWTYGTSTVVFDGNNYNKIEGAAGTINFANVEVSRNTVPGTPSKNIRLLNPVLINTAMTFNKGRIYSTTTNYLSFGNNATCTVTNDDSAYVHGPVRKIGDDVFTFPLGDTTLHDSIAYHPLAITAPSSTTDRYEAVYHATGQTLGSTLVDTLASISNCEYWTIEKQNGSSNVYVKVFWNQNSCGIDNYDDLRLAGWLSSGSKWIDLGVSDFTPGFPTGGLRTAAAVNFGTQATWNIVIGQRPNADPYAILKKKLDAGYYQCSNGKLMFRFEDEYNDPDAKLSFRIYNDQYGLMTSDQLISSGYVPNVYYGSNYYLLNVLDCNVVPGGNVANGFFILEVINEKNEHWFLRFKHTTTLSPNCIGNGGETE